MDNLKIYWNYLLKKTIVMIVQGSVCRPTQSEVVACHSIIGLQTLHKSTTSLTNTRLRPQAVTVSRPGRGLLVGLGYECRSWHCSCSQLPPALGVFRRFLTQFLINLHEILQALFATIPAPTQPISWNLSQYFKS